MTYEKPVMRFKELKKMGFMEEYLWRAYQTSGSAWKLHPEKKNSPIMFDTEAFEAWRQGDIRRQSKARELRRGMA